MLRIARRANPYSTFNVFSIARGYCSYQKFDKILVANRGEIACRVIDTCRRMGIRSVAVYSEADKNSLHTHCADESVCIGPAPSQESYLNIANIIQAAKVTGAKAVHPGYGFLSENATFVKELESNQITFIGPSAEAISLMGDKIQSKKFAETAKVKTIPGFVGEIDSPDHLLDIARQIEYPVMIKASAGGGGKGMRIANDDEEALEGYWAAKKESADSFGDDRILLEKYIEKPRHIEAQILCDSHGNAVFLNERECSIQRRNQKIIEEAPSPLVRPRLRTQLMEEAIKLAKAVDYTSAGTVEFLVDEQVSPPEFYFLEMNTRLQVEHGVTEAITGIDIVEQMIRIAAGETLSFSQEDIPLGHKWAIESRIYAEDPVKGFLPSIGKISKYQEPSVLDGTVRVDSGIKEGSEISVHYDPLMVKLITVKEDRMQAIDAMKNALDIFQIEGVQHNIGFLRSIMCNTRYMSGDMNTNFLAEEYPKGFEPVLDEKDEHNLVGLAVLVGYENASREHSVTGALDSNDFQPPECFIVTLRDKEYTGRLNASESLVNLTGDNIDPVDIKVSYKWITGTAQLETIMNNEFTAASILKRTYDGYVFQFNSNTFEVKVQTPVQHKFSKLLPKIQPEDHQNEVLAPMPGKIHSISIKEGEIVEAEEPLMILEAMKMQNVLRAPKRCKVKRICFAPGDDVSVDQSLIELEDINTEPSA